MRFPNCYHDAPEVSFPANRPQYTRPANAPLPHHIIFSGVSSKQDHCILPIHIFVSSDAIHNGFASPSCCICSSFVGCATELVPRKLHQSFTLHHQSQRAGYPERLVHMHHQLLQWTSLDLPFWECRASHPEC